MDKIKVSIVIPVYNTEGYVREAVNSIRAQTLSDIEIIVINDGSTDNSYQVIKTLASEDERIRIYTQKNKGLSETRNLGIKKARGKYIYFMDSDDLLKKEALLDCYEKCEAFELDFLFFDAETFSISKGPFPLNYHRVHVDENIILSGSDFLEKLLNAGEYRASACLNFINLSYLLKINLVFYPKILHEDELFTLILYINAVKVGYLNHPYFKRRLRDDSIMGLKFSRKNLEGYFTVISQLIKLKKNTNTAKIELLVDRRISEIVGGILYNARTMKILDRQALLRKCLSRFRKYISFKDILLMAFPITRYFRK